MATLKIVPQKDWEILRGYLYADDGGAVVLLPEDALKNFPESSVQKFREHDGDFLDYGFGGEPDIMVDVVKDPQIYSGEALLACCNDGEDEL